MEEKKYKLTKSDKEGLFRIVALRDFSDVKAGDIGGYVSGEHNLSHDGICWIYDDAKVYGNARVFSNAKVCDNAQVFGNARVYDNAQVFCIAWVHGNALIYNDAKVFDDAVISDSACVYGNSRVYGNARVYDNSIVYDNAEVYGNTKVFYDAVVCGNVKVCCDIKILDNPNIRGNAVIENANDYLVFKNSWSSGRYFTWTRSNDMWNVGCFYGTGEELIQKAYKDSKESGDNYRKYVEFVERKFLNEGFFKTLTKKILRLKYKFY
jgi:carbonic anhydrase/acetyltransferase-like protein (isoleucine patch superfamily)